MIVVVAPGQGSQKPGFLAPWIEDSDRRAQLDALGDAAGLDLIAHGTVSDADTIKDTRVAQPLIVAAGLITLASLRDHLSAETGIAGHSVGEITAAAGAGILTDDEAIRLVAERGRAMAEAASMEPTGMAAVLGADEATLAPILAALGLSAANFNGAGQIVVAGPRVGLDALREAPPAGTRVIALETAGAFHTDFMAPAATRLADAASATAPKDPVRPIWTNRDGTLVSSGTTFVTYLVEQMTRPVRWDACMASFAEAGVTGIIELAPAGALVGLARRGLKGVPTVGVSTPDDLPAAIDLLNGATA